MIDNMPQGVREEVAAHLTLELVKRIIRFTMAASHFDSEVKIRYLRTKMFAYLSLGAQEALIEDMEKEVAEMGASE